MPTTLPALLSTNALAAALDGDDVVVLDTTWARSHEGPKSPAARYAEGHLPGARHFDFRRASDSSSELTDTVCSAEQFEAYVRELGITDEHIVCCSGGAFSGAARAFWLFQLFGHERVSVLDGGLGQWTEEGRALSTDEPEVGAGAFTSRPRAGLLRRVAAVEEAVAAGAQLVDARPLSVFSGDTDFFAGTDSPAAGITGHIDGALHLPTSAVTVDGLLRPIDELRRVVAAAGIDTSRPTITTCSLGVGASGAAFVLHLLGAQDAGVFDGSWEAWATRDLGESEG